MTESRDRRSLMDDRQFLAELEDLDRQSPETTDTVAASELAAASDRRRPAASYRVGTHDDAIDPDLFVPSSDVARRPAVFDDGPAASDEPVPRTDASPIGLVPVLLLGVTVGGGAAALVFHERLALLLFGG